MDYASFPNPLMGSTNYSQFEAKVKAAAESCTNPEAIYWGACNIVYPKCLLGYTLQLCRHTCLGELSCDRKSSAYAPCRRQPAVCKLD